MTLPRPLAIVLLAAALPALSAEPLAIKTGAWEMSYTTQISGDTMPQAMLDKMTPEQKARHEERLKKRAEAGPRKRTQTTCVKKENLERNAFAPGEESKSCTYKVTAQTRSLHAATYECTGAAPRKGEFRYEALGNDRIKGLMKMTSAHSSMEMQMEGRWIGPTCAKGDD